MQTNTRSQAQTRIPLKSNILKLIDGTFLNADSIAMMMQFKRLLQSIRVGNRSASGNIIGRYVLNNTSYGTIQLAEQEAELMSKFQSSNINNYQECKNYQDDSQWLALQELLVQAKHDFIEISSQFRAIACGAKEYITTLIKESCKHRDRSNSMLIQWTESPSDAEDQLFDASIKTFGEFEQFCIDLGHFFDDLIESCPRAHAQFEARSTERKVKWSKIRPLLTKLITTDLKGREAELIHYINQKHLDSLSNDSITTQKINSIIDAFYAIPITPKHKLWITKNS